MFRRLATRASVSRSLFGTLKLKRSATAVAVAVTATPTPDVKEVLAKREALDKERAAFLAQQKKTSEQAQKNIQNAKDVQAALMGLVKLPTGEWCHPTAVHCTWNGAFDSSTFTCYEKNGQYTTCRFDNKGRRFIIEHRSHFMGVDTFDETRYFCAVCVHEDRKCQCPCCHDVSK